MRSRRPAYGLLFGHDSTIGGGSGISSAHTTVIGAGRAVGEVTGLPSAGERRPARSSFLDVAESPPSTGTPWELIPRGPPLAMVAFTLVERGEMTLRFSSHSGQRTIQRGLPKSRFGEYARRYICRVGSVCGMWRRLRGELPDMIVSRVPRTWFPETESGR